MATLKQEMDELDWQLDQQRTRDRLDQRARDTLPQRPVTGPPWDPYGSPPRLVVRVGGKPKRVGRSG